MKLRLLQSGFLGRFMASTWGKVLAGSVVFFGTIFLVAATFFYWKYAKLTDEKLKAGPFPNTALLYAAPRTIVVGDAGTPAEIASMLRRSGYSESKQNSIGWYQLKPDTIEIYPEAESYYRRDGAVLKFNNDKVSKIIALRDNSSVNQYSLEPELITTLFDQKREKRRIVRFGDLPPILVKAVLAAEDKRFFEHSGFDPVRIAGALWFDFKKGKAAQGASTLSMQVARTLWLSNKRTFGRKFEEVLITVHLEQKLSKEQIFEYYANGIYLGHSGSFSIHGFAEGARVYFGKELAKITLPEAAMLAGLPQVTNQGNPIKHPEKGKARRNLVLGMMRENGFITQQEFDEACNAPIREATEDESEFTEAPYFVDLVNEQLTTKLGAEFYTKPYRIYTTLDPELQADANAAVKEAIKEVDAALKKKLKNYPTAEYPLVQTALVAIDPQTGEVRAMVGGRNYGVSQLNRAMAKRQPGSSFKPFVYAAALNTGITGQEPVVTTMSQFDDEPTTFKFNGETYSPGNFHEAYFGRVSLRQALIRSMNIPTVKVAQQIGYRRVVDLARRAGMNTDIRATPSVALGAYEVTPIEVAAAYSIFANRGIFVEPTLTREVRSLDSADAVIDNAIRRRAVLDPRVAYLVTNMMQDVMRSGTGAGTRGRGFWQPAAGKTGSSRDGWFVGFTSKLICAVWVGFDDGKDIGLEGARTALPIWTDFMKRAHQHRFYRNVSEFYTPDGIVSASVDPTTGLLANAACPKKANEVFIAGTQPVEFCKEHGLPTEGGAQVSNWEAEAEGTVVAPPGAVSPTKKVVKATPKPVEPVRSTKTPTPNKKRGFLDRIRGIVKSEKP